MRNICCLNQISHYGTDRLTGDYKLVDDIKDAEGILVRSVSTRQNSRLDSRPLPEPEPESTISRSTRCAKKGIVVFNTPGANKNGVKELVLAGLFLTSRDVVGGIRVVQRTCRGRRYQQEDGEEQKAFAGNEIRAKAWSHRSWRYRL